MSATNIVMKAEITVMRAISHRAPADRPASVRHCTDADRATSTIRIQTKRLKSMNKPMTRRGILRAGIVTGALIPMTGLLINRLAMAAPVPLDPSDPTAKALQYVTASVKPGQKCDGCAQYQGKPGDMVGGCTIFPGKSVTAGGWCLSWIKKPAA